MTSTGGVDGSAPVTTSGTIVDTSSHEATITSLFAEYESIETGTRKQAELIHESLSQVEQLSNQTILFQQYQDGEISGAELLTALQQPYGDEPSLYVTWAEEQGLDPANSDTLRQYINASPEGDDGGGGLGVVFDGDPLTDTSWVDDAIQSNEVKSSNLVSLQEIDTLELQASTNQLNILVTLISSIVRSHGDALLSVANKS